MSCRFPTPRRRLGLLFPLLIAVVLGSSPGAAGQSGAGGIITYTVVDSLEAYRAFKANPATAGLFTEIEVNRFGYQLMGAGQIEAATEVFRLNAESYPNSFNVYDSLGEAYMNAGKKKEAVESYEKSLALNPGNTNAVEMLKKLREE